VEEHWSFMIRNRYRIFLVSFLNILF